MGTTREQGDIGCYTNILEDKIGDWTIGFDGLEAEKQDVDAKCPGTPGTATMFSSPNASLGEYPMICPTPRGIAQGAFSFTFMRRDLATRGSSDLFWCAVILRHKTKMKTHTHSVTLHLRVCSVLYALHSFVRD